jgi:hypothetical protein
VCETGWHIWVTAIDPIMGILWKVATYTNPQKNDDICNPTDHGMPWHFFGDASTRMKCIEILHRMKINFQAVEFTGLPWDLIQICTGWMGKNHTQSHFCIHGKVLSSTFRNFDIYNVLRYWLETSFVSNMLLFAWHPKYLPAKQKWTTFTFNPMGNSNIYILYYIDIYRVSQAALQPMKHGHDTKAALQPQHSHHSSQWVRCPTSSEQPSWD